MKRILLQAKNVFAVIGMDASWLNRLSVWRMFNRINFLNAVKTIISICFECRTAAAWWTNRMRWVLCFFLSIANHKCSTSPISCVLLTLHWKALLWKSQPFFFRFECLFTLLPCNTAYGRLAHLLFSDNYNFCFLFSQLITQCTLICVIFLRFLFVNVQVLNKWSLI